MHPEFALCTIGPYVFIAHTDKQLFQPHLSKCLPFPHYMTEGSQDQLSDLGSGMPSLTSSP